MIDHGFFDRTGRRVTLREVGDENWRAVADIVPLDEQRSHVPAMAARYLLLSMREDSWNSLAVYADDAAVGHVMWGLDEDGSHWIGGMLIDGAEQGKGLGRALLLTMTGWLAAQEGCWTIRLAYQPDNAVAGRLYTSLGFVPTGAVDGDEVIAELAPSRVGNR
ncbi:GNAT family N-acetyltransferase [Streptomyces yerevanensis]|uniref:GNAT family N-acetyltransferase n=1 Tax=Streptomyces yerevanensis TaxID=66378 RepID=UPI00052477DC|nr:GNAT family N-acetyltransferase [Streptomyces yerevanensis]